ncbi:uncharacterized protein [Ambystoma mexicanum]|uniref:uncharacterized protein n=1 Tax=Ambystoma mexicanum TaxID=8296 RepID=UPI0037E7BCD1
MAMVLPWKSSKPMDAAEQVKVQRETRPLPMDQDTEGSSLKYDDMNITDFTSLNETDKSPSESPKACSPSKHEFASSPMPSPQMYESCSEESCDKAFSPLKKDTTPSKRPTKSGGSSSSSSSNEAKRRKTELDEMEADPSPIPAVNSLNRDTCIQPLQNSPQLSYLDLYLDEESKKTASSCGSVHAYLDTSSPSQLSDSNDMFPLDWSPPKIDFLYQTVPSDTRTSPNEVSVKTDDNGTLAGVSVSDGQIIIDIEDVHSLLEKHVITPEGAVLEEFEMSKSSQNQEAGLNKDHVGVGYKLSSEARALPPHINKPGSFVTVESMLEKPFVGNVLPMHINAAASSVAVDPMLEEPPMAHVVLTLNNEAGGSVAMESNVGESSMATIPPEFINEAESTNPKEPTLVQQKCQWINKVEMPVAPELTLGEPSLTNVLNTLINEVECSVAVEPTLGETSLANDLLPLINEAEHAVAGEPIMGNLSVTTAQPVLITEAENSVATEPMLGETSVTVPTSGTLGTQIVPELETESRVIEWDRIDEEEEEDDVLVKLEDLFPPARRTEVGILQTTSPMQATLQRMRSLSVVGSPSQHLTESNNCEKKQNTDTKQPPQQLPHRHLQLDNNEQPQTEPNKNGNNSLTRRIRRRLATSGLAERHGKATRDFKGGK